jgi:hypothetical protein
MTKPTVRATADALLHALLDARSVELELLDGLTASQMLGTPRHFVEPPIWGMGHVGGFQEMWVLRHLDGARSLLSGSDRICDSFNDGDRGGLLRVGLPHRARTNSWVKSGGWI